MPGEEEYIEVMVCLADLFDHHVAVDGLHEVIQYEQVVMLSLQLIKSLKRICESATGITAATDHGRDAIDDSFLVIDYHDLEFIG